jgi:hypothetical protein
MVGRAKANRGASLMTHSYDQDGARHRAGTLTYSESIRGILTGAMRGAPS